jgi:transposase-like protein
MVYSEDFKREIVKLRKSGKSVKDLCGAYSLGKNTVRDWVVQYDTFGNFTGRPELSKDDREKAALVKRVRSLEKQVEENEKRFLIIQHALSTLLKKKR